MGLLKGDRRGGVTIAVVDTNTWKPATIVYITKKAFATFVSHISLSRSVLADCAADLFSAVETSSGHLVWSYARYTTAYVRKKDTPQGQSSIELRLPFRLSKYSC